MKRTDLTILQRFWLEALWLGARAFAVMPYWFKYYVVENLLFGLLYYCLRYRMKVVKTNLRNSFPGKSERELALIRRRFYRTLSEIFVDTINMAYMNEEKGRTVLTVKDVEKHVEAVHGRDWIAMTAHFGCWEYCSYWGLYERSQMLVAVYHPLRSKVMEELYRRLRNYENSMTVSMKESLRFYLRNRAKGVDGKNLVMGLIADQNPPAAARQPLVPLPQSGYDLLRRRRETGPALQPSGLLREDEPPASGTLRNVLRTDLRRQRGGRRIRNHAALRS